MGRAGPAPTPQEILERRGSRRAGPVAEGAPAPEKGKPRCPHWLNKRSRAMWRVVAEQLDAMGVLATIDGNALARYCEMMCRFVRLSEYIEANGETYEVERFDKDGNCVSSTVQMRPEVAIAGNLDAALLKLEKEFGMTPSARARVKAIPERVDAKIVGKGRFFSGGA